MTSNQPKQSKCSFGLSSFDLVGGKFSFEFPTLSRKLQTKVGSCLTFIIGLVAVLATVLIGLKYFDTSSPSITFSNEIGPEISHNLLKELMLPPITVYQEGAPITGDISRLATIKAFSATFAFDPVSNVFKATSLVESAYVDCKQLNDPYFNELLSKIDSRSQFKDILKCPDLKGNNSLADVLVDSKNIAYKFIFLKIFPCSHDDLTQCISAADVNKLRVVVASTKKTIVPSNYSHPFITTVTMDEIPVDPATIKFRKYESKVTKIIDLRNDILGVNERDKFVSIRLFSQDSIARFGAGTSCPKATLVFIGGCPDYISFQLKGGSEVIQVKRQYNSPTEIMGEIGGVLKVALMFLMVYTIYNQAKKKSFIIESVFSRRKGEKADSQKGKEKAKAHSESGSGEGSGGPGRVKVVPKSVLRKGGRQYSKKVKEECFRSATCFSNLLKNVNFLDLLESLALNEYSKKILPLAILVKRMIMKSPILREKYYAANKSPSSKDSSSHSGNPKSDPKSDPKSELPQGLGPKEGDNEEEEEEKVAESEPLGKLDSAPSSGVNTGSRSNDTAEEIKERLKIFIESQIYDRPLRKFSRGRRSRSEAKSRPSSFGVSPEAELLFNIPKAKEFGNNRKVSLAMQSIKSEDVQSSLESQRENQLQKPSQRRDSETSQLLSLSRRSKEPSQRGGRSSRLSSFSRRSSFGQKVLVKSRFKGSKGSKGSNKGSKESQFSKERKSKDSQNSKKE